MRRRLLSLGALVVGLVLLVSVPTIAGAQSSNLLTFQSMTGVPKFFTGATNKVRDLAGGGLPWHIDSAHGVLSSDGNVVVTFSGLVLDPNDPDVIAAGLAGRNPVGTMKVIVSCLATDGSTQNRSTPSFPVTTGLGAGDGRIQATVDLPNPCIAPLIFITTTGNAWFAVTGG